MVQRGGGLVGIGVSSRRLLVEEVELAEDFFDVVLTKGDTRNDYGGEEIFFSDVASAVEIHGSVGFVRASENVA